jgi:spoIIIJ-associated protein
MKETKIIQSEVKELLGKLGVIVDKITVKQDDDTYFVLIKSDNDAPLLIGYHGETLQAIQRVVEVILFKTLGKKVDLVINVNDYRELQKERLEKIAENIIQKVLVEKKQKELLAFSPFERKIIHEYVAKNYPQLTSYSQGEGKERKLIIVCKEGG